MKNKKMKKYKFNIDKFLNILIYTWLFFPFIVSVIILIYRIITKREDHMSGELWGFCGALVTAIITLIGVIIGVSVKRPKVKNTDEIKSDIEKINNKIGKNDNKTLYGQNDEIIKFLNDNLKDKDSTILEVLGNVNKYVLEEEIKKKFIR